ncbi:MAG: PQQ-binding-like beta-propeller repeat protein [Saprospirales bacterium]|nr:PQQ-binding-like beta-propeller repeat protein [Saprospirales bacterium]
MKSTIQQIGTIFVLLFSFNLLPGQDVSLQLQIGGSEQVFKGIGACFGAEEYEVTNNMPFEINYEDNQVTVNQFGSVLVQFTVSVPLTTSPGIYYGSIIYEIYQIGGSFCFADTLDVEIEVIPALVPVPDFSASPSAIIEGGIVQFTNLTQNTVIEWLWEFGDGDTSTLENPSHTYAAPGTYSVSLTAVGLPGSATETKTDFIQVFESGTPGISLWSFEVNGSHLSSPAIGTDGTIYFGTRGVDDDGFLYALYPDGNEKFKFNTSDITFAPAIGKSGTIYVAAGNIERLYALNADGTLKWFYQEISDGNISSNLAIGLDESIYFGTNKGDFYSIDSLGNEKWHINLNILSFGPSSGVHSISIDTDGTIYLTATVGVQEYRVFALNQNGDIIWEWDNNCPYCPMDKLSISKSGVIYITGSKIFALNRNGTLFWAYPADANNPNLLSAPIIDEKGNIYIGSRFAGNSGKLYSLTANGELSWILDLSAYIPPIQKRLISSPVLGNNGDLYCYSEGGVAFGINHDEGTLLWNLPIVPPDFNPNGYSFGSSDGN